MISLGFYTVSIFINNDASLDKMLSARNKHSETYCYSDRNPCDDWCKQCIGLAGVWLEELGHKSLYEDAAVVFHIMFQSG